MPETNYLYPLTNYVEIAQKQAQTFGDGQWSNNSFQLASHVGKGEVVAYNYPGFSVMYSKFELIKPAWIGRSSSDLQGCIDFCYILDGLGSQFENEVNTNIEKLQFGCYLSTPSTESKGYFENGIEHKQFFILVEKDWLETFLEKSLPAILQQPNSPLFIYTQLKQTLLPSIVSLLQSDYQAHFGKQHFYAKALELLTATVAYIESSRFNFQQINLSAHDIALCQQINGFIKSHLESPLSVERIVREFGVNRNKVQQLFKAIYGQTLAHYIRYTKMQEAYTQILRLRNVAEVGRKMGYSNLSHFSNAFKKIHGVNPSQVLKESPTKLGEDRAITGRQLEQ